MNKYIMYSLNLIYLVILCVMYWFGDCKYDVFILIGGVVVMIAMQGMLYLKNSK